MEQPSLLQQGITPRGPSTKERRIACCALSSTRIRIIGGLDLAWAVAPSLPEQAQAFEQAQAAGSD